MGLFSNTPANAMTIGVTNDLITKTITNFAPSTTNITTGTNFADIRNSSNITNKQVINAIASISSVVNSNLSTSVQTSLDNAVSQELEKKSVALLSSMGNLLSNNNTDIKTTLGNKVGNIHLTSIIPVCASDQTLSNIFIVDNSNNIDSSQTIEGNFYQSCLATSTESMNSISDITNTIAQKAIVTETNPLDFLSGMFSSIGTIFVILIILSIVVGMVFVYKKLSSTSSSSSPSLVNTAMRALPMIPI